MLQAAAVIDEPLGDPPVATMHQRAVMRRQQSPGTAGQFEPPGPRRVIGRHGETRGIELRLPPLAGIEGRETAVLFPGDRMPCYLAGRPQLA